MEHFLLNTQGWVGCSKRRCKPITAAAQATRAKVPSLNGPGTSPPSISQFLTFQPSLSSYSPCPAKSPFGLGDVNIEVMQDPFRRLHIRPYIRQSHARVLVVLGSPGLLAICCPRYCPELTMPYNDAGPTLLCGRVLKKEHFPLTTNSPGTLQISQSNKALPPSSFGQNPKEQQFFRESVPNVRMKYLPRTLKRNQWQHVNQFGLGQSLIKIVEVICIRFPVDFYPKALGILSNMVISSKRRKYC